MEKRLLELETLVSSLNGQLNQLIDEVDAKEARILVLETEITKIRAGI